MEKIDLNEKRKADAKNALEEYCYNMRDRLSTDLSKWVSEEVCLLTVSLCSQLRSLGGHSLPRSAHRDRELAVRGWRGRGEGVVRQQAARPALRHRDAHQPAQAPRGGTAAAGGRGSACCRGGRQGSAESSGVRTPPSHIPSNGNYVSEKPWTPLRRRHRPPTPEANPEEDL